MFDRKLMDKQQCRRLIELYCGYRRLWDRNHPDYSDKKLRFTAWKNIGNKMNLPVGELKKKMDSLLGSYRRERSREKQSRLPGGRSRVYKSNWYAYKYFSVMRSTKNAGCTQNATHNDETTIQEINENINIEEIEEKLDQNGTEAGCDRSKGQIRYDRKIRLEERKRKQMQKEVSIKRPKKKIIETVMQQEQSNERITPNNFDFCKQYVGPSTDAYYSFGIHIANELRKYDPITLTHVKKAINNIIFKADIKSLQQNNTDSYAPLYASAFGDSLATTSDISIASPIRVNSPILPPSPSVPISDQMSPPSPTPS